MQRRNKHSSSKFTTILIWIWTKIYRYFGLAGDISSFKRTFYSILYADRSGRGFQLGKRPSCAKFVNIYSILPIINRYFGTFWDISTFKSTFYSILDAECSAHYMQRRNKHSSSKFTTIWIWIWTKIYRYFGGNNGGILTHLTFIDIFHSNFGRPFFGRVQIPIFQPSNGLL